MWDMVTLYDTQKKKYEDQAAWDLTHELIEECAAFPNGEYDDLVDSTTQALMRYRQGNFIELPSDDWDAPERSQIQYYG